MAILPLFAIPLYLEEDVHLKYNLDLDDVNQRLKSEEWEDIVGAVSSEEQPTGKTTVNKMLLTDPKFADVRHAIHSEMSNYVFNVLCVDEEHTRLDCNRSWSMYHRTLDFAQQHCHENCLWSGILYTKMPEQGGGLTLTKESLRHTWMTPSLKPRLKKSNELNANEMTISPQAGTLVIFPSFTFHGTPPNLSNEDRLNVVVNYSVKGTFGDDYYEKQIVN